MLVLWLADSLSGQADQWAILDDDAASLEMRLAMIDAAQHEIGMAYWTMNDGQAARAVVDRLCQRAACGVKVLIILDGLATRIPPDMARRFSAAGVQVRIFHPLLAGRPMWLNRRLHSKLLIVDSQYLIVGSRNLSDMHFGMKHTNFVDCDVAIIGEVSQAAAEYFQMLWDSMEVVPLEQCWGPISNQLATGLSWTSVSSLAPKNVGPPEPQPSGEPEPVRQAPQITLVSAGSSRPPDIGNVHWLDIPAHQLRLLHDQDSGKRTTVMADQVIQFIDSATQMVLVETPYPAFSDRFRQSLQRASRRGVTVTILTNSLLSTNQPLVYAAHQNQKAELLRAGIELYEFDGPQHLHAKSLVVDSTFAMVGSYNFDHRSEGSDLELCVVSDAPLAAQQLEQSIQARRGRSQLVTSPLTIAPVASGQPLRRAQTRAAQLLAPWIKPLL
ncbi:MAG: phosphatidylserine/phosphatidylglycerophosphate/cardiolipin synthase family protein [Pirellulaceae bacterium]|nr:phosphatidylserine/phosphatidylglycerophosphate/cardiolipin synthase family protein [Pirellulaceae bacterium]